MLIEVQFPPGQEPGPWQLTGDAFHDLAVLEKEQRRYPHHAVRHYRSCIGVRFQLEHDQVLSSLLGN